MPVTHHMASVLCSRARPERPIGSKHLPSWPRKRASSQFRSVSRCSSADIRTAQSGGDGPPKPPRDHDGDGGNGDGSGNNGSNNIPAMLAAAGRAAESLPGDMAAALQQGRLKVSVLERYLWLDTHWFFKLFTPIQGFRERLLADPGFFVKVGIECGIGIVTKCAAEYEKRKGNFSKELDFVTANVIMAIIADFMLVWLPAPTMRFGRGGGAAAPASKNVIARYFASCPDNMFQKVPAGFDKWTLAQRLGAPVQNGVKLLGVGFGASLLGVAITNTLIFARQMLDPSFESANGKQNPLTVSAAYATYMATSSNLRYQILAGVVEERGIETLFAGKSNICHALSLILRTGNTFLGSLLWVDFIRLLKLQPPAPAEKRDCCNA